MSDDVTHLQKTLYRLRHGTMPLERPLEEAWPRSNSNAGKNVYLAQSHSHVKERIEALHACVRDGGEAAPLLGVPVSVKDCFDVAGYKTTCGSQFYAENNQLSLEDSWLANQIIRAGAVIVGKTHMHPLAYGITGENLFFGDCTQPVNSALLTGGSSSGAAASIQEGSALVAIGTDTGGSIRVPAALCGVVGYRSSVGVGSWQGSVHLASSFDTMGFLYRDLRDSQMIAEALLGIRLAKQDSAQKTYKIAVVGEAFLHDCDADVLEGFTLQKERFLQSGAEVCEVDTVAWSDALEIFTEVQASEAAAIQRAQLAGRAGFEVFEPAIAARLAWGESLSQKRLQELRKKHAGFQAAMDLLLAEHDFLMMPCAPVAKIYAGADHSEIRHRILRYTCPVSLAGMPAVTIPLHSGAGVQLVAGRGRDAALLAFVSTMALGLYCLSRHNDAVC